MIGRALGFQYLIDLQGCNPSRIANSSFVRDVLLSAAREAGATIVTDIFHQFNPYGVSGVVVIAESHVAIHTWPEHGFASIDFFSCSDKVNADRLLAKLAEDLQASGTTMQLIERGRISAQGRVEVVGFE